MFGLASQIVSTFAFTRLKRVRIKGHNMDSCDLRSELTKTTDEIDEPPPRLSISAAIGVLDFKQCDIRIPGILLKDGPVSRSMLFEEDRKSTRLNYIH